MTGWHGACIERPQLAVNDDRPPAPSFGRIAAPPLKPRWRDVVGGVFVGLALYLTLRPKSDAAHVSPVQVPAE
jgi:hypothetical protein